MEANTENKEKESVNKINIFASVHSGVPEVMDINPTKHEMVAVYSICYMHNNNRVFITSVRLIG